MAGKLDGRNSGANCEEGEREKVEDYSGVTVMPYIKYIKYMRAF